MNVKSVGASPIKYKPRKPALTIIECSFGRPDNVVGQHEKKVVSPCGTEQTKLLFIEIMRLCS